MSSRKHVIGSVLFKEIDCRQVAPAEPAWDAKAHTIACAWSELLRLEAAHAPREKINAQRRHAKALTRRWSLAMGDAGRRLEGRPVDDGSIASVQVVPMQAVRKSNGNGT